MPCQGDGERSSTASTGSSVQGIWLTISPARRSLIDNAEIKAPAYDLHLHRRDENSGWSRDDHDLSKPLDELIKPSSTGTFINRALRVMPDHVDDYRPDSADVAVRHAGAVLFLTPPVAPVTPVEPCGATTAARSRKRRYDPIASTTLRRTNLMLRVFLQDSGAGSLGARNTSGHSREGDVLS